MIKGLLTFYISIFSLTSLIAQDLFFQIKVDASTANTSETRVFTDMENAFKQFMNETKWTDEELELFERIKGVMVINITDIPRTGRYQADMQVQSVRPVYNSNYESIMFNIADRKLSFDYTESQPLIYTKNSFNNNLVSILAFYANFLLGMDFDSFSELGGQKYYDEALNIARSAQQQGFQPGWEQFGNLQSKYALVQSALNSQLEPVRKSLYLYYRKGLDMMEEDPKEARKSVLEALENIQKANKLNPNSPFITVILQTKSEEIVQIFTEGDMTIRRKAYEIMRDIAPANSQDYEVMIK
ncbi:DUF4835 domain-containing protein [Marivirga tractuosa]|uniref:DUF4835 domain-containing protein n=1 Tax=Marivirga tractuosa (strain ATCC 23168 / DSM 4126 / NBRC 15989 / NCIMB 1408 / VKM B-1430 / H-43) TaxID=643867 RepID=E4TTQ6_MARTH|nr:DUF4835 family protein [Marivirga tractuosa]ADR20973.1 hypothetical protein Ftrac_0973 [Marivirga tractuosa DSM 4126]BDD14575.1 DUF4835 domain-containing protein [Marivirga tractuosa]